MFEELKELHEKELIILKEFDRVCKENHLTYYLAYGTLLGAVRHKGFIPWDDDIDVCMKYSDYKRLEEVCKEALGKEFFLQTPDSDPNARLSYYKLRLSTTTLIVDYLSERDMNHGINIDIYPLYNVPDSWVEQKIQFINSALYLLLQAEEVPNNHGIGMKVISIILLGLLRGKVREKVKQLCHMNMAKYEQLQTKKKALLFGNLGYCRKAYPSSLFYSTQKMKFEDSEFSVPVGYDEYLKIVYGDYKKLPPKEEQGAKLEHLLKIDTNISYLNYKGILYCVDKAKIMKKRWGKI